MAAFTRHFLALCAIWNTIHGCPVIQNCPCVDETDTGIALVQCRNLSELPSFMNESKLIAKFTITGSDLNKVQYVQNSSFDGLNIVNLQLTGLSIERLDTAAFHGLEADLEELDLSYNNLSELHVGSLASLTGLTKLSLSHNMLEVVDPELLKSNVNLIELGLDNNRLVSVSNDVFSSLGLLRKLNLDFNLFTSLPIGLFSEASSLEELRISQNPLVVFPDVFRGLNHSNLKTLFLHNCGLKSFADEVFEPVGSSLMKLYLQFNPLTNITDVTFQGLSSLDTLDLMRTGLVQIEDTAFSHLQALNHLYLSGSGVTNEGLADILSQLNQLESIDISWTNISELTNTSFYKYTSKPGFKLHSQGIPLRCDCGSVWLRDFPNLVNSSSLLCQDSDSSDQLVVCFDPPENCQPQTDNRPDVCDQEQTTYDPVRLNVTFNGTSISIWWEVQDIYFKYIRFRISDETTVLRTETLSENATSHIIHGVSPFRQYNVCVTTILEDRRTGATSCIAVDRRNIARITTTLRPAVDTSSKVRVEVIVIGVLAGVVAIVAAVIAIKYWRRRNKEDTEQRDEEEQKSNENKSTLRQNAAMWLNRFTESGENEDSAEQSTLTWDLVSHGHENTVGTHAMRNPKIKHATTENPFEKDSTDTTEHVSNGKVTTAL